MQAGTVFGYQGLVSGLLDRLRRELAELANCDPGAVKAILTGGLAAAPWAADLPGVSANDPNLTLSGLAILHAEAGHRGRALIESAFSLLCYPFPLSGDLNRRKTPWLRIRRVAAMLRAWLSRDRGSAGQRRAPEALCPEEPAGRHD